MSERKDNNFKLTFPSGNGTQTDGISSRGIAETMSGEPVMDIANSPARGRRIIDKGVSIFTFGVTGSMLGVGLAFNGVCKKENN